MLKKGRKRAKMATKELIQPQKSRAAIKELKINKQYIYI